MKGLLDYLEETMDLVEQQLTSDQERWGDTWRHRAREGQEERAFYRFLDYYDQYLFAGVPIPWTKIIGEAHIALVRENHPEELIEEG